MAVPAITISGWWFVRNWYLYHDPLALNVFLEIVGRRPHSPSMRELLGEIPGLWLSFWGVLGNFNILLPQAWYGLVDVVAAAACLGLLIACWRARHRISHGDGVVLLLLGWPVLEFTLLVRYTEIVTASTGRLLLAAAGCIAVLLAVGIHELAGRFSRRVTTAVAGVLAMGAALVVPVSVLPAYAPPTFVSRYALPPADTATYRYGHLELADATIQARPGAPSSTVYVTLSWLALGHITVNDVVSLQLLGPDGSLVAQADSLPAGGKVLTTTWPPTTGLVDRIPLRIPAIGPSPARDHLAVFVYPLGHPDQRVQSVNAAGQVDPIPEIGLLTVKGTTPYTILAEHRPDVLRFYAANGWDAQTEGRQIFDNWLQHGPDGGAPTTASAYVKARGWASKTRSRAVSLGGELFDQRQ